MQRYLWMVVCLVWTQSMAASTNPFELDRNFKYIEKDQADLISELKVVAQKLEEADDELDDIDEEGDGEEETLPEKEGKASSSVSQTKVTEEPEVSVVTIPSESTQTVDEKVQSKSADATEKGAQKSGNAETTSKKDVEKEISRPEAKTVKVVEEVKPLAEEKAKAEQVRQKALAEQREAAKKAQAEAEARKASEETKRLAEEKAKTEQVHQATAAKTIAEPASKKEEVVLIEQLKQKRVTAEKLQRQASVAQEMEHEINGMGITGVVESDEDDINITREQMEAAKRAQEELLKAIAAVDRED